MSTSYLVDLQRFYDNPQFLDPSGMIWFYVMSASLYGSAIGLVAALASALLVRLMKRLPSWLVGGVLALFSSCVALLVYWAFGPKADLMAFVIGWGAILAVGLCVCVVVPSRDRLRRLASGGRQGQNVYLSTATDAGRADS